MKNIDEIKKKFLTTNPTIKMLCLDFPQGGTNTAFLDMLGRYDKIYVAGEAKSHCVLETMNQILRYFASAPDVIKKVNFLTDCTSSVAHPTIDFESMAQVELAKMAKAGVVMTKSTDPV